MPAPLLSPAQMVRDAFLTVTHLAEVENPELDEPFLKCRIEPGDDQTDILYQCQ